MEQDYCSECSSGCESGWTFYLGRSMYSCDYFEKFKNYDYEEEDDDDDDDDGMSMVSDASSGPPHVQQHEQEQECNKNGVFGGGKRENFVKKTRKIQDSPPCFLDDTATSSFFNFSHVGNNQDLTEEGNNVNADYPQDHFQGKSRFQDQFGGFKLSISGTQSPQNQLSSPV